MCSLLIGDGEPSATDAVALQVLVGEDHVATTTAHTIDERAGWGIHDHAATGAVHCCLADRSDFANVIVAGFLPVTAHSIASEEVAATIGSDDPSAVVEETHVTAVAVNREVAVVSV